MKKRDFDRSDAKRVIAIYREELVAMANAAAGAYPNYAVSGALICEPGTTEGESLRDSLAPRIPARIVEDGTALLVMSREDFRNAVDQLVPAAALELEREEFAGRDKLPILAVCKNGFLMGVADR